MDVKPYLPNQPCNKWTKKVSRDHLSMHTNLLTRKQATTPQSTMFSIKDEEILGLRKHNATISTDPIIILKDHIDATK